MTPEQKLQQVAMQSRNARLQANIETQSFEQTREQYSGMVLGYDGSSGRWMVQLESGSVVNAIALSPTGGRGIGDVVSVYKDRSGSCFIKNF